MTAILFFVAIGLIYLAYRSGIVEQVLRLWFDTFVVPHATPRP